MLFSFLFFFHSTSPDKVFISPAIAATTIAEIEKVLSQGSLSFTHDLSCLASILFSRERTLKLHGSGNRSTLGTIVGDESCDDHRGSCFSRESCDF